MGELDLVSTDALIQELSNRHKELIVIREHKKILDSDNVFVKTPFSSAANKEKGFDLLHATEMLNATQFQLAMEYVT